MPNGHPRDQINTDLQAGRPTLSRAADPLALRVAGLMSGTEAERMYNGLQHRVGRSPAYLDWAMAPTRYLSEFDPATASAIEVHLDRLRLRLIRRAKARGSEVED